MLASPRVGPPKPRAALRNKPVLGLRAVSRPNPHPGNPYASAALTLDAGTKTASRATPVDWPGSEAVVRRRPRIGHPRPVTVGMPP